jgi:hypothetical protein
LLILEVRSYKTVYSLVYLFRINVSESLLAVYVSVGVIDKKIGTTPDERSIKTATY